ncbi:MAG: hypothetical protein K2H95_08105, partial [Bacteroidales bacterium]|nr:hypothetical protein [Bacteroidales bacterium]
NNIEIATVFQHARTPDLAFLIIITTATNKDAIMIITATKFSIINLSYLSVSQKYTKAPFQPTLKGGT